jgi:catechol 2,3-dioxygenase-like lactoylglutathione lyase family enzyme
MNLNQVTVPARNIPRAIRFYQTLGLKLIVHSNDDYARFECPDGQATFSLHRVEQLPTEAGVVVYFELRNLDAEVARLQELGIEFETLPTTQRWLWREARLKDLDGNQLILFYGGKNRKNPPWRLVRG